MGDVAEFMDEFEEYEGRLVPGPKTAAKTFEDVRGMFGPGVYALLRDGEVIYVGKAKVLVQRIYNHWNAMCRLRSGKESLTRGPQAFIFSGLKILSCPVYDLDRIEKQMISRFRPKHNTRLVPKGKMTLEQIGFDITRLCISKVVETPMYRRRVV